jgi:hypothetical protein
MNAITHQQVISVGATATTFDSGVQSAPTSDDSSLLPQPVCLGGDAITQLAVLMTQCGVEDQKNSTACEDAANQAAAKDDAARVAQMMDKANQDWDGALASGLGDIAGGALGIAGAAVSSPEASGVLSNSGKVMPGFGTIVAGGFKSAGDQDDARTAEYQAASDMDVRAYDEAQSNVQSASDQIQKVEQYLQQLLQTQNDTRLKAAGG